MKTFVLLFPVVLLVACQRPQSKSDTQETTASITSDSVSPGPSPVSVDTIAAPAGLTKLGTATGDLDKDGRPETVIVYDSQRESKDEMGTERELHIFKMKDGKWELWHKSLGAVMPSQSGGMMGDPFQQVTIENGCIVLHHFGGSREKWTNMHRFRFQDDDWKLIGATVNFGAPCEYWTNFDYNLSTGKIVYEKKTEDCSESAEKPKTTKISKSFTHKLKLLPGMDEFKPGENEVKLPGLEDTFYF